MCACCDLTYCVVKWKCMCCFERVDTSHFMPHQHIYTHSYSRVPYNSCLCCLDCVAARRYTNNTNHTKSRDNEEPSNEHNSLGEACLDIENSWCEGSGQRLVYVSDQYGSDEESSGLPGCCGWVGQNSHYCWLTYMKPAWNTQKQ